MLNLPVGAFSRDVTAAMLVYSNNRILLTFCCFVHHPGRLVVLRGWVKTLCRPFRSEQCSQLHIEQRQRLRVGQKPSLLSYNWVVLFRWRNAEVRNFTSSSLDRQAQHLVGITWLSVVCVFLYFCSEDEELEMKRKRRFLPLPIPQSSLLLWFTVTFSIASKPVPNRNLDFMIIFLLFYWILYVFG